MNLRLSIFLISAVIFGVAETFFAYRKRELSRTSRWPSNVAIVAIGSVLTKLILPAGLSGVALWANTHHLGLFNILNVPVLTAAVLTFIIFDYSIYLQHVYSHKWKLLWIFHRVHHTDPDLDFTSALRFHPVEILYSLAFKVLIILLIGANATSVLVFEIVLNTMAMFNHTNINIPPDVEKYLRKILVTPQMHIIHHSVVQEESDSNYGFNFSLWDFLFKTYTPQFKSSGVIGQSDTNKRKDQRLLTLIVQPFKTS